MPETTATSRKGRKYDDVLNGAQVVFMRDGFDGASVDEIAREAGVSKATLYSYFPDKRMLFLEIMRIKCQEQANAAFCGNLKQAPAREALTSAATIFVRFIVSPLALSMHNLIHGEAKRFPELAHKFYKMGPEMGKAYLIELFEAQIERGELKIDDLEFAAEQFAALCKADLWVKCCLQMEDSPTEADIKKVVTGTVDTFLARYGLRH
ncbi:TetR/AcrR family transcriptional regulator [Halocynthiibacter namhaensis]|uniref:TetR/AcrR family transcriptional regulator n=1 Tax=Halocynthiibacter namhaensis TaxID=1290553 RepID=UPI000578EDB5|nr:TetR/AcrR family transcriptional regulator [Halocynthiibacter namhaensis]